MEVVGNNSHLTGEIIESMASDITSDFVVLPCDFITDIDPRVLINDFRNRDNDVLITGVYYKNNLEHIDKKALESDVLIHTPLDKHQPKVVDSFTREGVTDSKYLSLRMAMLWRYSNVVASTKILNSGISCCSRKVLDIIGDKEDRYAVSASGKPWYKVVRDFSRRSWRHRTLLESVAANVLPAESTFMRANNLSVYLEANRYIMKELVRTGSRQTSTPHVKGAATISPDSVVDASTTIAERSTVKKSAIGRNCKIGSKCRITGCVIFDDVVIEDDAFLENCLIGKGAVIELKVRLTSCNVEGQYVVTKGAQMKNEILQSLGMDEEDDQEYIYDDSVLLSDNDGATSEGSRWADDDEDDEDDEEDDGFFDRS